MIDSSCPGATQAELADIVDVSRQTIISIERKRYVPSLPLALKLAQHFTCTVEDLFELELPVSSG